MINQWVKGSSAMLLFSKKSNVRLILDLFWNLKLFCVDLLLFKGLDIDPLFNI